MSDFQVDLSTGLEMTREEILCIHTIILVTFLLQYLVCKINIPIKLYSPHCHFDWSDSAMEKSFFELCDYTLLAINIILLLIFLS